MTETTLKIQNLIYVYLNPINNTKKSFNKKYFEKHQTEFENLVQGDLLYLYDEQKIKVWERYKRRFKK